MAAVRHTARLNTDLRENILTMAALVTWTLSVAVGCTDHYHGQLPRSGDWDTHVVVSTLSITVSLLSMICILIVNLGILSNWSYRHRYDTYFILKRHTN